MCWYFCVHFTNCSIYIYYLDEGGYWIDSDSTSELMLGKLLAETDKLVTSDWYYSTSIRVFNINIIYFLCWKIFQSWKAVRCVSQVLGLMLLYLSQCFFYYKAKSKYYMLWPNFLLLPISLTYFKFFLFGLYYLPYLYAIFVLLGILFGSLESERHLKIYTIIAGIISFCTCLEGMRLLLNYMLPIFLVVGCLVFSKERSWNIKSWNRKDKILSAYGVTMLLSSFAGILVNAIYFQKKYDFVNYDNLGYTTVKVSRIEEVINGYLAVSGYDSMKIMTLKGVMNGLSLLLFCGLILFVLVAFLKIAVLEEKSRIILLYATFSNAIMMIIFLFTSMMYADRYLLITYVFFVPAVCIIMENELIFDKGLWKSLFEAGMVMSFLGMSFSSFHWDIKNYDKTVGLRETVAYLLENGYHFGYSNFWSANVVTELSNGKIDMYPLKEASEDRQGSMEGYGKLELYKWLVRKDMEQRKYTDEPVFVLVPEEDYEILNENIAYFTNSAFEIYSNEYYRVYGFADSYDIIKNAN